MLFSYVFKFFLLQAYWSYIFEIIMYFAIFAEIHLQSKPTPGQATFSIFHYSLG